MFNMIAKKPILLILLFLTINSSPSSSLTSATGVIRTPNTEFNSEGYVSFNYSVNDPINHFRFTFSPYSWFEGSFFYNDMNALRYNGKIDNQSNKDKGFSAKIKLLNQDNFMPSLAIGFEDLAGTGYFSSEYLVAGYSYENLKFNFGLGWGRLGSLSNLSNPLKLISDSFDTRDNFTNKKGGMFEPGSYFSGDSGLFGSLTYDLGLDYDLVLKIEYDTNNFSSQRGYNAIETSRYNYGISFKPISWMQIGMYHTEGNDSAFNIYFSRDFSLFVETSIESKKRYHTNTFYNDLLTDLASEGILVQEADYDTASNILRIKYIQLKHNNETYVANLLAQNISESNEFKETKFQLIPQNGSVAKKQINLQPYKSRSSKVDYDKTLHQDYEFTPIIQYPFYEYELSPSVKSHIGSPAGFYFGQLILNFNFNIGFRNSYELESVYTIPLKDNFGSLNYNPNSTDLEPVRTNVQKYLKKGGFGFDVLKLNKIFNPKKNNYIYLSIGHFEQMFSGLHAEYLNKRVNSNISFGAEASIVRQRDYDKGIFSFQDYSTSTYHINFGYFYPKFSLDNRLSIGKYLAKDVGFTFESSRVFTNGARIGAFFSKTNISAEQFGEGSFDKGIFFSYPLNLFSNQKVKGSRGFTYRPITRDGAAKLSHSKRLLDILYDDSDFFILINELKR